MTITIIRKTMLALASAALFAPAIAQSESKEMKLKTFESEVLVEVSKEKAWKVLSS